jgi:hypothetical protein
MRDAHVNKPKGRGYNAAISAWDKKHGFADLDKGVRSRLLDVMRHLAGIEAELAKLSDTKRQELNHPNAVWRFWKRVTKPTSTEQRTSPVQKLKDTIVALQEQNDRMQHEIERGGGDLWTPEDRPKDIARIIVGKLTKAKAEKVARIVRGPTSALSGQGGTLFHDCRQQPRAAMARSRVLQPAIRSRLD